MLKCIDCGRPTDDVHAHCEQCRELVLALRNRDEWHHIPEAELGSEIDAGQCDSCGSFVPDSEVDGGEPGPGFIVRNVNPVRVTCGCCDSEVQVMHRPAYEVVF
jgi:hypothetical protein